MANDNFVAIGYEQCPACGTQHTESVLVAQKLKYNDKGQLVPIREMNERMCTGLSPCPDCKSKIDEGFVILVAATPPDADPKRDTIKHSEACRTGDIVFIHRRAWGNIFNIAPPEGSIGYTDPKVVEYLRTKVQGGSDEPQ